MKERRSSRHPKISNIHPRGLRSQQNKNFYFFVADLYGIRGAKKDHSR